MQFTKQILSITITGLMTFLFLLGVPSQSAIAKVIDPGHGIKLEVQLTDGTADLDTHAIPNPDPDRTVRQVLLSLDPPNATGTIQKIEINGITPTGDIGRVFGCNPGKVQDGVDLIKKCGGPAILREGGTLQYIASITGFSPETTKLKIILCDNFKGSVGSDSQCP